MRKEILEQIPRRALLQKLERQLRDKRARAKRDGIAFTLTHEQILELALGSPHWHQIGRTKGSYHICRHDHSLGYTTDNTFIGSALDNNRERNDRCGNPKPKKYSTPQARCKAWRQANPEKTRAQHKTWRDAHPEKIRAYNQTYRNKKAAAALQATAANSNQKPSEKRTLQLPFES
jgi:hypothetical protein